MLNEIEYLLRSSFAIQFRIEDLCCVIHSLRLSLLA